MHRSFFLAVLATGLLLSVYLINGAPLFYFDTAGYVQQGEAMLEAVGLTGDATPGAGEPSGGGPGVGEAAPPADATVVGSRSAAYSLVLALIARTGSLDGVVALNVLAVWVAAWIPARRITVETGTGTGSVALASFAIAAAGLGALPFYVAFAMPDVLAPALVLCLAALCVWGHRMTRLELGLAVGLSLAAVVSHPSHLLLLALMLPVGLLAAPTLASRRLAVAAGLLGLLLLAGIGERLLFSAVVARFEERSVAYLPFLTARLVDDGPGLRFLAARCPDEARPTCALQAALDRSDDPRRLDAPNILFSRYPATASFRTLPQSVQDAVSRDQLGFARDVLRAYPWEVARAVAVNVAAQLARFRIDMTLHAPGAAGQLRETFGTAADRLREGRLATLDLRVWTVLAAAHAAVYATSLAATALLIRHRAELGLFALLVIVGILLNALICGAVSEPADRYGARVVALLPLVAALAAGAARRRPA